MTEPTPTAADHSLDATALIHGQRLEIRPGRQISLAFLPPRSPQHRVVFFVHGGGGNKDQWRYQWQALAAQGHGLVAWDLLGHGDSDKPRTPAAYAWDELVADLLAVFARFGGTGNTLVAHSYGTALGLDALVRLAAAGRLETFRNVLLLGTQLQSTARTGGLLRLPVWALELLRPLLARGFRERAWHPHAAPALVAYEEALTRNNPLYVFKALLTQARWIPQAQLGVLSLPIHILAGDSDGLTPQAGAAALAQALPDGVLEVLPECGHQLMLERPALVNRALARLLA
ncbi:MAG: alpha/beta hydrolase [Pseudoxanthomonas sp.]